MITVLKKNNIDLQLFISNDESTYNVATLYCGLIRKGYRFCKNSQFLSTHGNQSGVTFTFEKFKNFYTRFNGASTFNWGTPFFKNDEIIGMKSIDINVLQTDFMLITNKISLNKTINFEKHLPELNTFNRRLNNSIKTYNDNTPGNTLTFTSHLNMHMSDFFDDPNKEEPIKHPTHGSMVRNKKQTITQQIFESYIPDDRFFSSVCDKLTYFDNYYHLLFPIMYLKLLSRPKTSEDVLNVSLTSLSKLRSYAGALLNPVETKDCDKDKLIELCNNFKRNNVISFAKAKIISITKERHCVDMYLFNKIPILKEEFFRKFKYIKDPSFDFVAGFLSNTDLYNALEVEICKNVFINI